MRAFNHSYTWQQYLRLAAESNVKLEYLDGEIFAMAGGTPEHSALAAAVGAMLSNQLEGKACRVYTSDLRIRVQETGFAAYPDVPVVCGQPVYDPTDKNTIVNPTVLVEVLSDSTEAYDRGGKFEQYRRIASLQEYVLVSHREQLIEVFRRGKLEDWQRSQAGPKQSLRVESLGCELNVDKVYAGIELHRGD